MGKIYYIYFMHIPVLQDPILSFFREKTLNTFLDGTLGAGGHALSILKEHPEIKHFIGLDQDLYALGIAKEVLKEYTKKITLVHANFEKMQEVVQSLAIPALDGIFLDIGVSSMQLDIPERGFSFLRDGPLDMRMNQEATFVAEDIVNSWSEKDLSDLFFELGEERRSRQAAKAIVQARKKERIDTTQKLVSVLAFVLKKQGRVHPATRIFQALRMAVNRELEVLKKALTSGIHLLCPGGRMGILSFHSLEDRLVKQTFKEYQHAHVTILTKKPIIATREEQKINPRSRSAKLRFIEKM